MREASDYGKVGGTPFTSPNIKTEEVFKERLAELMGTEYVRSLSPILFRTQYHQYCKTEERFYKLQQQIKDQQELIEAAVRYIEESPCDPDIYPEQLKAHQDYTEKLKHFNQTYNNQ